MKKFLKLAVITAAMAMFVSAAAEAQGGGGGGGRAGGGARGGGGGRGNPATALTAEGVSADSAYTVIMNGITVDATKKTAIMALVTKWQTDLRANPAPARGGGGGARGGGGGGGGGVQMDSAAMAAAQAANAKRMEITEALRTEVKKHLTAEQATAFDANLPAGRGGRGRGGF